MSGHSETEKDLFWVFDDLHCPHPLSPMFYDIGGWWLTCDHMFRRFGTPFAVDWIAKNVNGYLYTAAVPADPDLRIEAHGVRLPLRRARAARRRLRRRAWASTSTRSCRSTASTSPTGGATASCPRWSATSRTSRSRLDRQDEMSLAELAVLLEDAIDIHDRHWKIHWMLNFAQLSATLNLRAVMEQTRGAVDDALLGRLQNSATDRNWDSIEALWEMKNEVRDDPELRAAFGHETTRRRSRPPSRLPTAAGASSPSASSRTSGSSAGTPSGATSSSSRRSASRWSRSSSWSAATSTPTTTTRARSARCAGHRGGLDARSSTGSTGEALDEMRAANEVNLRMAPLTPDHHFYIDQGANAHVRLVLIAIGRKLVENGRLDQPDDVMFLRYNELRALIGDPTAIDARGDRRGAPRRARAPRSSSGRATGSAP